MPINVDTMIQQLQDTLGVDDNDPGFSQTDCLLLLNRSFWEICNKFKFREKETSFQLNTIAGTDVYNIPAGFEAVTLISIEDPITMEHTPLTRISVREHEMEYANISTAQGPPEKYYRYNNQIRLLPVPDDVYTLTVFHLLTLQDLALAGSVEIPQEWDEVILDGAIYRGYKKLGDFNRAKASRADQQENVSTIVPVESKEEGDSSTAGVDIPAGVTILGYQGDY